PLPASDGIPLFAPWIVLATLVAVSSFRGRPPTGRILLAALVSAFPANLYEGRYLIPAASLAALAFATSEPAARLARGRWLAPLAILATSFSIALAARDLASSPRLPVTSAERERFLSKTLHAYPAIAWLNVEYGSNYAVFGLRAENLLYFARGRLLGDWEGLAPFEDVASARTGDDLSRVLGEMGAGWLLFDPSTFPRTLPGDESFRRRFTLAFRSNGVELYRIEAGPARGPAR
ncbi:MAG: hypothetical protein ACHQ50_15935, partial [Fimbriimonadales bacterium]